MALHLGVRLGSKLINQKLLIESLVNLFLVGMIENPESDQLDRGLSISFGSADLRGKRFGVEIAGIGAA